MQVIIDGLMTEYVQVGKITAPKLLILHGWGSSSGMWQQVIRDLATDFNVIALDLPGFGRTDEPKTAWDVSDYANFVQNFLKKVHVDKLHGIVGHSFGGRVIIDLLDSGWKASKKIILVDAAGVKHRETKLLKVSLGHKLLGWARKIKPVREFMVQKFGSDDYRAASSMMREVLKQTLQEDQSEQIKHLKGYILVIWGEKDTTTPLSDLKIFRQIPNVKVEVIKDAGHNVYLDQPAKTIQLIRDFLK